MAHPPFASRFALALALASSAAAAVSAQTRFAARSGYGTDDLQVVTISHVAFLPHNATQTYFSVCCATDSYRRPTAGSNQFFLPLHSGIVPNGARIEQIDFFVRDTSAAADVEIAGYLCYHWTDLDGTNGNGTCSNVATSGSPGDTILTLAPDLTVEYETDIDGDPAIESVNYVLAVQFGINAMPDYSINLRLRGARILYRRQVSPSPSSASFADVPTGHPFFQFVEALAASGITAGCGTGIYCPDAPLTRGQMAVFLAKALGLHWPAVASP